MSDKMKEAFEQFLINEMGPHVLAGNTMSMYDAMQKAWQAAAADAEWRGVVEMLVEGLRKCKVELSYCETQLRASRKDYRRREDMEDDKSSVGIALREGNDALAQAEKLMGRK